ncbi:MAG: nitroreductase family protein [Acidobacteriota bacterium]|nr:nitroreductase family protein [Acidobacteriota bacterium]
MEFSELLRVRRSVRRYQSTPLGEEQIAQVLAAVRTAPTAGNFQAYEIYVVRGPERMKALAAASFNHGWIAEAPAALVICTNAARCQYDNPGYWALQDASIAATLAHLAATNLGLASCWVGAFVPEKLAEVIAVEPGHVPMAILTLGLANEAPPESPRREVSEFAHPRE